MEESIFNLIPKEYVPEEKQKQYKSKYPKDLRPTGTTFTNHTTSRPGVANLNGDYAQPLGPHHHKADDKTFGKIHKTITPDLFLKKTDGGMILKDYQTQF